MPKEIVKDEDIKGFEAKVLWSKDVEYVQIATINRNSEATYEEDGEVLLLEGFHVTLDRSGVNRLIRNLRRARDQAFGRDE